MRISRHRLERIGENRVEIMAALLKYGELTNGELAAEIGTSKSTVTWHLTRMEKAGLVNRARVGRTTLISAANVLPEVIEAVSKSTKKSLAIFPSAGNQKDYQEALAAHQT